MKRIGISTFLTLLFVCLFFCPQEAYAIGTSNYVFNKSSLPVYEKLELEFQVQTTSLFPLFEYATNVPQGVTPGVGVSVSGEFINTTTGKTYTHPAFYMTKVNRIGSGQNMYYEETAQKVWMLRFSPQEVGTYDVFINAQDSSGTSRIKAGSFSATSPTKPGFIQVSKGDSRYFQFSNGEIYWPIGPAWFERGNWDYSLYNGTGQNLNRYWMAGSGAYSGNWARWKSSAEQHGNEGHKVRVSWTEKAPGSELSYEFFYPEGHRQWVGAYLDNQFAGRIKSNTRYSVKLRVKTQNITGPRVAGQPYGFTVKIDQNGAWGDPNASTFDNTFRNSPVVISHINQNKDWHDITLTYTAPINSDNIYLYLDNVSSGQAYVDMFSMIPVNSSGTPIGGEIVRSYKADIHTYVDQRPLAHFDYMIEQGEKNGVFHKMVVHDKNDWVQNHLSTSGAWVEESLSGGYYQPENTKARWLLRQWYRYLAARYGYSTSVFAWELNNEGPPNAETTNRSKHWDTTEAFAKYIKQVDAHPKLATTSFWCCWRPDFWSNKAGVYGSVDYADIHDYTQVDGNSALREFTGQSPDYRDFADWRYRTSLMVKNSNVGKPTLMGEIGIARDWGPIAELQVPNTGVWYHNLLWVELADAVTYGFGYWFPEHIEQFNRMNISKPFYDFVKSLDFNKGGYSALGTVNLSDSNLRAYGQKNLARDRAVIWIQNRNHTWQNVLNNPNGTFPLSGTVTIPMNANKSYPVLYYNTFTASIVKTSTVNSNSTGSLTIDISGLSKDIALKVGDFSTQINLTPTSTLSPTLGNSLPGDGNNDGKVDGVDYIIWLNNYGTNQSGASNGDFNNDGKVDGIDYVVWLNNYGNTGSATSTPIPTNTPTLIPTGTPTPSPSPVPTNTPTPTVAPTQTPSPTPIPGGGGNINTNEWIQHGHDAQRTSYTSQTVSTPWRWKWSWNGSNSSGGISTGKTGLPRGVQPVTGGGRVYVAAGSRGIFALNATNGEVVWNASPGGSINSTVAYDPSTQAVFAVSSNGSLYKLSASTGAVSGSFNANATSSLPLHPMLLNDRVVFSMGSRVIAVNKQTMAQIWSYTSSSPVVTPPSYSNSKDRVFVGSQDLFVHAISSTGTQVWRVKPTVRTGGSPNELSYGWPVVSDANNLVLIKYRLDWNTMWTWNPWPTTNTAIRTNLQGQPNQQALLAVNMDTGAVPFITNVGHGGYGDGDYMPMGPQPVVKRFSDGNEVAYTVIRGTNLYDGRWDSNFGEVILNNNSVTGYQAGEVRWINYISSSQYLLTDEQPFVSMSGDMLLGGHWMAGLGLQITDRSASRGSFSNRISSTTLPHIVTSSSNCGFSSNRYCSNGLVQDGDPRTFPAGFYIYYNQGTVYDRYWGSYADWVVSQNLVLFRSNDGAIVALENGNPTANQQVQNTQVVAGMSDERPIGGVDLSEGASSYVEKIYERPERYLAQADVVEQDGQDIGEPYQEVEVSNPGRVLIPEETQNYVDYKGEVEISGVLRDVFSNGKHVYLTFNKPHQGKFVIKIPVETAEKFNVDPLAKYKEGQTIKAKGDLEWYQGAPAMYIENEDQLVILADAKNEQLPWYIRFWTWVLALFNWN
jgi:hypothetical protein